MNPADVIDRLGAIERDLSERMLSFADCARVHAFAKRDYERRFAEELVKADRDLKVDERKAKALLALVADGTYKALVLAEAALEAHKAAFRVLETRASVGQSVLRALTQESYHSVTA